MNRGLLLAAGAFAAAMLTVGGRTPASDAAPSNIAYDEIVKFAIAATPPPPGNFGADYASITSPQAVAQATAAPAPKRRGLFGGFDPNALAHNLANGQDPGSALGNSAANTAQGAKDASVDDAMDAMLNRSPGSMMGAMNASFAKLANGTLTRKSFYGNWERTDDVVAQTAEIDKCDKHQRIELDLAKRTYRIVDTTPGAPSPPSSSHASCTRDTSTAEPAQPGTGVLDISSTNTALAPVQIEGHAAPGTRSVNTIAIEKATGSCKNGSYSVASTTYLSPYARAHPYCPLPRTYPSSPVEMATARKNGGCQLRTAMHAQGTAPSSNRLAYYELMQMNAPNGDGNHPISIVTERGNVKTLGASDAGLFEIPAGFTKQ